MRDEKGQLLPGPDPARDKTLWKEGAPSANPLGRGSKKNKNPLAEAIGQELRRYAHGESGFNNSEEIARRLVKIVIEPSTPVALAISAAETVLKFSYVKWGKPVQPIETGVDLDAMFRRLEGVK